MQRRFVVAALAATAAALGVAWEFPAGEVQATQGAVCSALCDSDGDFLPDCVEWTVLTNANSADTDGDETPDFVEVVEGGLPRQENPAQPIDQQMRVIITGPTVNEPLAWMHVFLRVVSIENAALGVATGIESFQTWLELPVFPGVRFPLDVFSSSGTVLQMRATAEHGVWIQFSVPLASPQVLTPFMPCTLYAESTIAGHNLCSGMKLLQTGSEISTLVPWSPGRFVLQSISSYSAMTTGTVMGDGEEETIETNQVCVLDLEKVGQGPGGITYEVRAANCEDANDLECSSTCSDSVGWVMTIPGGVSLIGGDD